jgi:transposase
MEAMVEVACGLDVHQETVVACVMSGLAAEKPKKKSKTFGTYTRDLEELKEWLSSQGCTSVAMESTGVYWKPVYAVLEGSFELVVGNAQHMKNVPGRKTDMKDAEWIASLLRHGLLRKSFVPDQHLRGLRQLVRLRQAFVGSQTRTANRLQKALVECNVKLAVAVTNVLGVSGLAMVRQIAAGNDDLSELAELARGTLRNKRKELAVALHGRVEEADRFVLRMLLAEHDHLALQIASIDGEIDRKMERYAAQNALLRTIPGISRVVAAVVIAEIGVDMSAFASDHHLAAWAGLAPGNNESAGKKTSTKSRRGNRFLKSAMAQAANAAVKVKTTYWRDKYMRLKARRGPLRALLAIAHKMLRAVYHVLTTGQPYRELGPGYLDSLKPRLVVKTLVKRLERLGYKVQIGALPATAHPPNQL